MTTSGTKTRALCVATRCTTVDQFVATFHRFCGDDESFFVATLTSRPIGLETPFSIQLADKQPVLRGLCIVLDAWATAENRYKRPGIRLGIKRLTADSQRVFDRLRAAAKVTGVAEASPPPGPLPGPPRDAPLPPPLPRVITARPVAGPMPAIKLPPKTGSPTTGPVTANQRSASPTTPPLPASKPALPALVPPPALGPAPPLVAIASMVPIATPPPLPAVAASPQIPDASPNFEIGPPAFELREPSVRFRTPAPIAVTRFQVALNVDAAPPSTDGIEFKPTELPSRPRGESRTASDADASDADASEDWTLAPMTVDRAGEPAPSAQPVERREVAGEIPAGPGPSRAAEPSHGAESRRSEHASGEAVPARTSGPTAAVDFRTPGSALVLPANPLQHLSDESIEGFVECTLYEDSGSFTQPVVDGDDGNSEVAASLPRAPTLPGLPQVDFASAAQPMAYELAAPLPPAPYSIPSPPPMSPLPPPAETLQPEPAWRRWAIIGGTALAAITIAFVIGRLVRGSTTAEPRLAVIASQLASRSAPPADATRGAPAGSAADATGAQARDTAPAATRSARSPSEEVDDNVVPAADPSIVVGTGSRVGNGPCRVTIATTPVASSIRLDDTAIGPSPLTIASTCERHKIEVSHARYQSQARWVTLVADEPQELAVSLSRPIHAVTVTSFPPGAEFSIGGRRAGTTPTVVQMTGFSTVNLTFSKPGFQSVTKKVYSKLPQDHVFVKLMK